MVKVVEERFRKLQQRYNDSLDKMRAQSSEIREEELNVNYVTKLKEARQILRTEGPTVQYMATVAESEYLFKELANMREADARERENVVLLELELAKEVKVLEDAHVELRSSEVGVMAARGQLLSLKTPRVFEYPKGRSVSPLGYEDKDACAYCGFGFVWKAAILSSCGCFLHPPCVAEIMTLQSYRCRRCKDVLLASSPIHLTEPWVAQFGGELNPHQQIECTSFAAVLEAASDGTDAMFSSGSKN